MSSHSTTVEKLAVVFGLRLVVILLSSSLKATVIKLFCNSCPNKLALISQYMFLVFIQPFLHFWLTRNSISVSSYFPWANGSINFSREQWMSESHRFNIFFWRHFCTFPWIPLFSPFGLLYVFTFFTPEATAAHCVNRRIFSLENFCCFSFRNVEMCLIKTINDHAW